MGRARVERTVEASGPVKLGIDTDLITRNNAEKDLQVREDHPGSLPGVQNRGVLGERRDARGESRLSTARVAAEGRCV